jgi:hypothetical protein
MMIRNHTSAPSVSPLRRIFTLEQRQRYGDLRRGGLPFVRAIDLARRVAAALPGQLVA